MTTKARCHSDIGLFSWNFDSFGLVAETGPPLRGGARAWLKTRRRGFERPLVHCAETARTTCPVRLTVQDSGLSIRKQGFDSPTGYLKQNVAKPGIAPGTDAQRWSGGQEITGSNPVVLTSIGLTGETKKQPGCRAAASPPGTAAERWSWEHEIVGSSPTFPTEQKR